MKKLFSTIICILILAFPSFAEASSTVTAKPTSKPTIIKTKSVHPALLPAKTGKPVVQTNSFREEEINPTDIPRLLVDPSKEIPYFALVPNPTPSPEKKDTGKEKDIRAWTTFEYSKLIKKAAEKYSIDPQVIYATIMTESEGNPYAFRYEPHIKDASFCMGQILLSTARRLGFKGAAKELYKPDICIDLIGKYHRNMLDTYGQLTPLQLATAYNAGSPYKRAVPGHLFRFNIWLNELSG